MSPKMATAWKLLDGSVSTRRIARRRPPLILISSSGCSRGVEFGDSSLSLSLAYCESIVAAGGMPLVLPILRDPAYVSEVVARTDGILLSGGSDIQPSLYQEFKEQKRNNAQGPAEPLRDWFELLLVKETFRQAKPLLAICRGHQLVNVAMGGDLIGDILSESSSALEHRFGTDGGVGRHEIRLKEGSRLEKLFRTRKLEVNSTHHQAVKRIAEPFEATAQSADGITEALELKAADRKLLPYFLSVQFHPERMQANGAGFRRLFVDFVDSCRTVKMNQS